MCYWYKSNEGTSCEGMQVQYTVYQLNTCRLTLPTSKNAKKQQQLVQTHDANKNTMMSWVLGDAL